MKRICKCCIGKSLQLPASDPISHTATYTSLLSSGPSRNISHHQASQKLVSVRQSSGNDRNLTAKSPAKSITNSFKQRGLQVNTRLIQQLTKIVHLCSQRRDSLEVRPLKLSYTEPICFFFKFSLLSILNPSSECGSQGT